MNWHSIDALVRNMLVFGYTCCLCKAKVNWKWKHMRIIKNVTHGNARLLFQLTRLNVENSRPLSEPCAKSICLRFRPHHCHVIPGRGLIPHSTRGRPHKLKGRHLSTPVTAPCPLDGNLSSPYHPTFFQYFKYGFRTFIRTHLGLYSLRGLTSYRKISWSLEAARFRFRPF